MRQRGEVMKRKMVASGVIIAAILAFSAFPAWGDREKAEEPRVNYVVRLRDGGAAHNMLSAARTAELALKRALPHGLCVVEAPAHTTPRDLERLPGVMWAEEDLPFKAAKTPNDPDYPKQWNLEKINMPEAWDRAGGGDPSVVIAVVDSGVAYRDYGIYSKAPDFASTLIQPGYDFIEMDETPDDAYGHGTHVAAIIASSFGNAFRAAGMAYSCAIMPVRVLGGDGAGTASSVASGIYYAADKGARVICLSLASPRHSRAVGEAVAYAYQKGALCVAAAGNEGSDPGYPGGMDCPADEGNYVLAVGATDYRDQRAHYSNYGSGLDLVAPGGDLTRDDNGDGYGDGIPQESYRVAGNCQSGFTLAWGEGTSMSAPQVAATAGLMLSIDPKLTPEDITQIITSTCRDLGPAGRDDYCGYGLLDAEAALEALGRSTWYFAEGTTRSGFEEWICILNSNDQDALTEVVFLMADGQLQKTGFTVPGKSRFSLNVRSVVGDDKDVAATVSSTSASVPIREPPSTTTGT